MFPYFSHIDTTSDAFDDDTNKGNNDCGTLYLSKGDVVYLPSPEYSLVLTTLGIYLTSY